MNNILKITSNNNEKIKFIKKLKKQKYRKEFSLFVAEGIREIKRAYLAGFKIKEVYFCLNILKRDNIFNVLTDIDLDDVNLCELTKKIFEKIAYRQNPEGIIAVFEIKEENIKQFNIDENDILLVLFGIEKPGNLGAILRSAESCNVSKIILCDCNVDIFNPNTIRSSTGAVFSVSFINLDSDDTIKFLKENKLRVITTTPDAENLYFNEDLKGKIAIVIGSEHKGLSKQWLLEKEFRKVKIPMKGKIVDSLNASVALSVVLFEAMRQRNL